MAGVIGVIVIGVIVFQVRKLILKLKYFSLFFPRFLLFFVLLHNYRHKKTTNF